MFTPLRHALSLAVGSALAVSASNALAGPYQSVFGEMYTQYFGGVGEAGAAYDGTQDILNWKPTEITLPNDTKVWTNLRTIYLTTGLTDNQLLFEKLQSIFSASIHTVREAFAVDVTTMLSMVTLVAPVTIFRPYAPA